jgi:acyl-homoserine lactone acylase PvdQ
MLLVHLYHSQPESLSEEMTRLHGESRKYSFRIITLRNSNVGGDTQDYFIHDDVLNGTAYIYKDGIEFYKMRDEIIKVKGEPDEIITVKESRYGPVMNSAQNIKGTKSLALSWVSFKVVDTT